MTSQKPEARIVAIGKHGARYISAELDKHPKYTHVVNEKGSEYFVRTSTITWIDPSEPHAVQLPKESRSVDELEDIYDCSFCDHNQLVFNVKTNEYEPCVCREKLAQLRNWSRRERKAEIKKFVDDFQTVAIPETTDYANGWNDCRKRVRKDLNRLATPSSTEEALKEEI